MLWIASNRIHRAAYRGRSDKIRCFWHIYRKQAIWYAARDAERYISIGG